MSKTELNAVPAHCEKPCREEQTIRQPYHLCSNRSEELKAARSADPRSDQVPNQVASIPASPSNTSADLKSSPANPPHAFLEAAKPNADTEVGDAKFTSRAHFTAHRANDLHMAKEHEMPVPSEELVYHSYAALLS